jgi:hypothetical protein
MQLVPTLNVGVSTLVGVMLVPLGARGLELDVAAPAACATEELAFRVERALATPLSAISGPGFRVRIEASALGFAGQIDGPATGQRRVTATTCEELIDTLALTLVLAIGQLNADPGGAGDIAEVSTPPAAASQSAPDSDEPVMSPNDDGQSAEPHWALGAALQGDTGSLPALGVGMTAGLGVTWPAIELRAFGSWFPGREGRVDAAANAPGADIHLAFGGAAACLPLAMRFASTGLAVCGGGELGWLWGEGVNVDISRSAGALWLAARGDVAAHWQLGAGGPALELLLTVAAPLGQNDFVLRDIGRVHRPSSVVGRASVGLWFELGP